MAHLTVQSREFETGFAQAMKDDDRDSEAILHDVGARVVSVARARAPRLKNPDPRYRPGQLAGSITMQSGRDHRGPWVDVGTGDPVGLFMEYGTYKDRAQPFLRPALSMAVRGIRGAGGSARASSARARAFSLRARKRTLIRGSLRSGAITGTQARGLSRQVTSTFRFRARRRR